MLEQEKMPGSARQIAAPAADETPTRLSGVIFVSLCLILVFSTIAFGAVDLWALGALSLFSGIIAVLWLADAWLKKEFHFSLNPLQIPLLGLIVIGIIQLLPLRRLEIPADLLSVPAVSSLSLAPYSTRFAIVQLIVYLIFFAAAFVFTNNNNRLRKIVLTIIIFGSLMAFYGTMQRFVSLDAIYGLRLPDQANPFGSFVNGHHFAAFMEMTVGLTLGLLFSRATEYTWRIFLSFAVVVMGMAIIFTSSRGGMLSLLAVIGFSVAANVLQKPSSEMDSP